MNFSVDGTNCYPGPGPDSPTRASTLDLEFQTFSLSVFLPLVITTALSDGDLRNCWNTAAEPNLTISFTPSVATTEYINIRLDHVMHQWPTPDRLRN